METNKAIDDIRSGAIEPWERLNRSLAEQRALETDKSDEAADAMRLAVEIRDLGDRFGLDRRDMVGRSNDWALLSAVADTGKKRLLSSAARRTALAASSHFEADGKGRYRFINNQIAIVSPAGTLVDFLTTAANAIRFLIAELALDIDWTSKILEGPDVFGPSVVLDSGPDPNRVFDLLQVRFYKREPGGELVVFQPPKWQLELRPSEATQNN